MLAAGLIVPALAPAETAKSAGGLRDASAAAEPPGAVGPHQETGLTLLVQGVRSDHGTIRVGIYRSAEAFPTPQGQWRGFSAAAQTGTTSVALAGLPPGTYGIAVYHDENGNEAFDTDFFGFPEEGFGFGNDAPVGFGPPDFADAAVTVPPEPAEARMTLTYW